MNLFIYKPLESRQPAFNWAGIIAYIGAATVAFMSGQFSFGVPPINGIIVAVALYAVLLKVLPQKTIG